MAEQVTLTSKTLKGRNRIREHGSQWRIIEVGNPQCFDGAEGLFIEAVEGNHRRWIRMHDDPDFITT